MSVIEDLKTIAENMPAVYAAGQLAGDSAEVAALSEKMGKIPFVDGEAVALTGATRSSTRMNSAGEYDGSFIDYTLHAFTVTGGTKYLVSGTGYNFLDSTGNVFLPLLVFTDENNNVLSYEVGTEDASFVYVSNYEVIAPDGAKTMFVNHLTTHNAVEVLEVEEKFEAGVDDVSDDIKTLLNSKGINFNHIWYANKNAVAKVSNPLVKVGGIEDFKTVGNGFVVMAASSVGALTGIIVPSADSTVTPSVVVGGYDLFNNGDLLVYAGDFSNYETLIEIFGGEADIWKRIPMHEAKTNLDGLMSAWDKTQVDKVPTIETDVANLKTSVANLSASEITFHTEEGLLNWISKEGVHFVTAQSGNGANPITNTENLDYLVYTGREFDGSNYTSNRFQLAVHLATGRIFYRKGEVASGGSFNGCVWTEVTTGTTAKSDVLIVTDDTNDGSVIEISTDIKEVVIQTTSTVTFHISNNAWNYWRCIINMASATADCRGESFYEERSLTAGKTYLFVRENETDTYYEVDNIYRTPITE